MKFCRNRHVPRSLIYSTRFSSLLEFEMEDKELMT